MTREMVDTRKSPLAVAALVRRNGCITGDLLESSRERFIHYSTFCDDTDYLQSWGRKEEGQTRKGGSASSFLIL